MNPMDFEENLWAMGFEKSIIDYLKKSFIDKTPVIPTVNKKLISYFRKSTSEKIAVFKIEYSYLNS